MHTLRRRSSRRRCYRTAKIQLGGGTLARDFLVIDISDGRVRLPGSFASVLPLIAFAPVPETMY